MNDGILVKVYGHVWPADASFAAALAQACSTALTHDGQGCADGDLPVCEQDGDMVRLSFEGLYFPLDEVLDVLRSGIGQEQQGKLDFLDLENWRLVRHLIGNGKLEVSSRSLNQVLEYSGF